MFDKGPKFIQGYEYVTIQNKIVNTFEVEVKCFKVCNLIALNPKPPTKYP
jgi:hypothetical protein